MGGGRPAQMMGFVDAVMSCLKGSLTFDGRASRSEYWWFALAYMGIVMGTSVISGVLAVILGDAGGLIGLLLTLIVYIGLIPAILSAIVRRLHDLGKSGWWYWICLIPLVGAILLLVWMVMDGEPQPNAYGDVPTNVLA